MCGQIAGLPMGKRSGVEFHSETPSTLGKTRINHQPFFLNKVILNMLHYNVILHVLVIL
jgi:hypothetical protein